MQPCSHAALQPCSLAAMQPCSHAAMQPCSHAALQPCSHASLQPCSFAAVQPCSFTALPNSPAAPICSLAAPGKLYSLVVLRSQGKPEISKQPYSSATNQKPQYPHTEALQLQHCMCLYYRCKGTGITNIRSLSCIVASGMAGTACKACNDAVSLALHYKVTCSCISTGLQ
jgi:hypothetical protein